MNQNTLRLKRYFLITIFINVKSEQFKINLYLVQYTTKKIAFLIYLNWSHNTKRSSILFALFKKNNPKKIKTRSSKNRFFNVWRKVMKIAFFFSFDFTQNPFCQDY